MKTALALVGRGLLLSLILFASISCADTDGGIGGTGLSFKVPQPPSGQSPSGLNAMLAANSLTLTDTQGSTLVIESAQMVLREIEFERVEADVDCDDPQADESDCDEFKTEPVLVSLPLDGSVSTEITANVPAGMYDEIEFDIHKVSSGDLADSAFLQQNPGFEGISIRVTGTYNDEAFEFTSDLNEEQELELLPPLEIVEGVPTNVTLSVDVSAWFKDLSGNLVDPQTANKDGINENLVKDNIKTSIEGFEDEDKDGEEDP